MQEATKVEKIEDQPKEIIQEKPQIIHHDHNVERHGHNKHEPVSGISRLTMILKGEDPETQRKKALMEDPE